MEENTQLSLGYLHGIQNSPPERGTGIPAGIRGTRISLAIKHMDLSRANSSCLNSSFFSGLRKFSFSICHKQLVNSIAQKNREDKNCQCLEALNNIVLIYTLSWSIG
ncbi:hypothetical protein Dimus_012962 [Dionaea muscipula]